MVDVIGSVFSVWYKGIKYVIHAYVSPGAGIGLGMESAVDVVERFLEYVDVMDQWRINNILQSLRI